MFGEKEGTGVGDRLDFRGRKDSQGEAHLFASEPDGVATPIGHKAPPASKFTIRLPCKRHPVRVRLVNLPAWETLFASPCSRVHYTQSEHGKAGTHTGLTEETRQSRMRTHKTT